MVQKQAVDILSEDGGVGGCKDSHSNGGLTFFHRVDSAYLITHGQRTRVREYGNWNNSGLTAVLT